MTLTGFQQSPLLTGLFYLKVKGPYGNACKINTFSCLHEYEYVQKNNCLHKNEEMKKKIQAANVTVSNASKFSLTIKGGICHANVYFYI